MMKMQSSLDQQIQKDRRNLVYTIALLWLIANAAVILVYERHGWWIALAAIDIALPILTGFFHFLVTHEIVERQ